MFASVYASEQIIVNIFEHYFYAMHFLKHFTVFIKKNILYKHTSHINIYLPIYHPSIIVSTRKSLYSHTWILFLGYILSIYLKHMVLTVVMWELDCEESWAPKNWCFWTVVLEKTLESPLDCKEIQPVHSKGDQSWVFIGRTDAKAETPILWPPHAKIWLTGKDSDAGRV